MGCKECGKPKCNGECGCKSPKVLQINNPAEYITFHKVSIPAAMGDSTTNPPKIGAYRNALVYYEADHTSWMYSTDGIPTKLTNGLTDYNEAVNLPQINGHTLIGNQSSSDLGLQGELTSGANIQINGNVISATDTTYTAGNGIELDGTEIKAKIGDGLEFDDNGEINIANIEQYAHFFDTVADMKAADLSNGEFAVTAGYYAVNDGGEAIYKIVNSGTDDGGSIITLDNGLKAGLINDENGISAKQFGAKIDNLTDDSSYIQAAIDYIHNNNLGIDLKLNAGTYKVSNTITIYNNVAIVLDGNVTLNTTTTNVAIHLLRDSVGSASVATWIRGSGQLKIVNTIERGSSGIGVKLEATSNTLDNIDIDNLNIRNFETDLKLIPLNVWNIRFNNCIFYHAVKGFEYQRDTITQAQNSGERISFEDCLFTQNDSDVKINGRLTSQMNFNNCSFDFSNCIFNIPYTSESGYLNSMSKVSMNQCHVEGICDNIDNLADYTGAYGILYMDGSYDLSFSMSDCTWVVYTDATYFNATGDTRKNCTININNIYVLNDITTPSHLFWSNRPAQMNINAENVNYRILHSVINNHSGNRVNSLPFAENTILNSNPLFENLVVGSYGTTLNTVIGDYKITEVSGISSITCSASSITSTSKKLTIAFDPDFSQAWYAVINLETTKYTPVNHLKPIALQGIINYINNLGLSFTIKWYDAEFNQISTFFDYAVRPDETDENISTPLVTFAVYPPAGACFCKFNYTINGKKSGNDVSRELEGLMLYNL